MLGVWVSPGGFRTIQKGGGLRPLSFWMVLKPPGTVHADPRNDTFSAKSLNHNRPNPNPSAAEFDAVTG